MITLLSKDRLCLALLFIKEYFISVLELHRYDTHSTLRVGQININKVLELIY